MRVRMIVSVVLVAMSAGTAWAGGGDPSRGAAYANAMCASCHSISSERTAASTVATAIPFRDIKIGTAETLTKYFNTDHPNTSRILKQEQADDIVTFMQMLQKPSPG